MAQAFTSKTCGKCGHLNNKLGGSRTFNCRACKHTEDRDVHAARNILLRYYLLEQGIGPALVLLQARSRKAGAAGTSPDPALAGNGNTGARKRRLSE